jgi:hypothetical protein
MPSPEERATALHQEVERRQQMQDEALANWATYRAKAMANFAPVANLVQRSLKAFSDKLSAGSFQVLAGQPPHSQPYPGSAYPPTQAIHINWGDRKFSMSIRHDGVCCDGGDPIPVDDVEAIENELWEWLNSLLERR